MNNIFNGVIPLWEPFVYSGRPFLAILNGGVLNPFVSLPFLSVFAGLSYYQAYLIFALFYFFWGMLGFYFLSRIVLKSHFYAFLSYVSLMFSGLGLMVFNQMYIMLIFVPSVWFFLFLIRFSQRFERGDFLGLIFSLMVMEISYYPFYLLTAVLVFGFFSMLFYPRRSKLLLPCLGRFLTQNKRVVFFALAGLVVTSLPLLMYKKHDQVGESLSAARHPECKPPESYKNCFSGGKMTFEEIAYGGTLGERISFPELFIHLDKRNYFTDDCFYIPIFCLLLIWLSVWTPFTRIKKLIICIWCVLLLISLGGATPIYRFLYDHIFYFKFFRNFFFFMCYLMPLMILFAMLQLKSLLTIKYYAKFGQAIFMVALHVMFFFLIHMQGDNISTSYWTVMASLIVFVLVGYGLLKSRLVLIVLMFVLILTQPSQVFWAYSQNASVLKDQLFSAHVVPKFSFRRPINSRSDTAAFYYRDFDFDADLTLGDSDGRSLISQDSGSKWYFLLMHSPYKSDYLSYLKHKLYLFDAVEFYNTDNDIDDMNRIGKFLRDGLPKAYAVDPSLLIGQMKEELLMASSSQKKVFINESSILNVQKFTVNEIVLTYRMDVPKFLVYTDNFTSDWHGFIDGKEVNIYRTNGAGKGMLLPAGRHTIQMVYRPFPGVKYYGGAWIFLALFSGVLIRCLSKENDGQVATKSLQWYVSQIRQRQCLVTPLRSSLFYLLVTTFLICLLVNPEILNALRINQLKMECQITPDKHKSLIVYKDLLRYSQQNK